MLGGGVHFENTGGGSGVCDGGTGAEGSHKVFSTHSQFSIRFPTDKHPDFRKATPTAPHRAAPLQETHVDVHLTLRHQELLCRVTSRDGALT